MKTNCILFMVVTVFALVLGGCGPSAEQAATMTASAWTPTPPPTSTPTPVPYSLSVFVTDTDSNPLEKAAIAIPDLGSESSATQVSDISGQVSWADLPAESVTLDVTAPGYFAIQSTQSLQPGENQVNVTLERDPNGFVLAEGCLPEEALFYIEDFQSGTAEGWDAVEFGAGSWALQAAPDAPENMIIGAGPLAQNDVAFLNKELPTNFVWRVKFMLTGEGEYDFFVNQSGGYELEGQHVDNSQYMVILGTQPGGEGPRTGAMVRFQDPLVDLIIANRWEGATSIGIWHYLQISNYDGQVEVWLDGEQIMAYSDPDPLPTGRIGLGNNDMAEDAMIYYDNMAVCELSAPFTPMPKPKTGFDLAATVVDAEGNPLSGVNVEIAEMGAMPDAEQTTDAEGKAAWTDLPGASVTLTVNAPGYHPLETVETIEKDTLKETTLIVERDPFGLLPTEACAPGETLLYIEDFQDGQAQGWPEIEFGSAGWSLAEHPSEPGNQVVSVQYVEGTEVLWTNLQGYSFDDAVWRLRYMYIGRFSPQGGLSLNWRLAPEPFVLEGTEIFDSRYQIPIGTRDISLARLQQPVSNIEVAKSPRVPPSGEWHLIEISTFQGTTEVWVDGTQMFTYQDNNPIPPGSLGLEAWLHSENEPILYFDNMSVCELSAAFAPMPTEK